MKEGPTGKLEAMTDDEYAAHVRAEMYKKTHQHLLEEKERREKLKKESARMAEEARRADDEAERLRKLMDESLRRGRERKEQAHRAAGWSQKWKAYESAWEAFRTRKCSSPAEMPWPVWSGKKEDIGREEIEAFFRNAPTAGKPDEADILKILKAERVRWHPDKIQQKLGEQGVEEVKMRAVTAVFQIIDRMWNEIRDKTT